ncbi:MAG TPA: hypothetical protein VIK89_16775 [Cytophagaceae bacterium]
MKRYFASLLCGLMLLPAWINAKETDSLNLPLLVNSTPYNVEGAKIGLSSYTTTKSKKNWFRAMRYSGWARFYPMYRNMQEYYDIPPTEGLSIPVNITANDGYQQPLMLIRMEGNPSVKTWFQTELQFDHLMGRTTFRTNPESRMANLYVIFQLQGGVDTRFGKFKMIAGGGVNWYRFSPFTLWLYQYRDDFFERYPWEPEGHDFGRYNSFYASGDIPRDQRFGMQGTQGFILEGTSLPGGFDAALLYGKASANAGYQSFVTKDPVNIFGSRIGKMLGDHKIGYNYLNQFGYMGNQVDYKKIWFGNDTLPTDTFYVEDNRISQITTTVDGRFSFDKFSLFAEVGVGSYSTNLYNEGLKENAKPGVENVSRYKRSWNSTAFFEITTQKSLTRVPVKLALYRVGKGIGNNISSVSNTSIESAKPSTDTPDEYYINYYDGMVTEVGQLANNRQGMNLQVLKDFYYNKLKTRLAIGMAQEIDNLAGDMRNGARAGYVAGLNADSITKVPFTNSITFEHKLNGLTRSRFAFFKRFTGPYNRLHSMFRRSFENIAITDTIIDYKKSFSTIDLELKYKCRFLGKELILTSFNDFSSVQENWSPIPVFTDKAFLRYHYSEFMAFYGIHQKITLVGFLGFERVKGNNRTELADANGDLVTDSKGRPIADPDGKAIDQIGHGYGLGLDYNFHSRASLHFRHRWFDHKDKNFTRDVFKGNEMTVEFKVFF